MSMNDPNMLIWAALAAALLVVLLLWLMLGRRRNLARPPLSDSKETDGPSLLPATEDEAAPEAYPEQTPASPFLGAPDGQPDDLRQIKGIGPKLVARLNELGVYHFRQIAEWTPEQLAEVDRQLGNFQGRPERDQWQSQARLLTSGDIKAYERLHGKLGPGA